MYLWWRARNFNRIHTGYVASPSGAKIYFYKTGTGLPLIFLHGGATFIECFAAQIPILAKRYQVIAIDTRGHGRSTQANNAFTYINMADDIIAVLDDMKITTANTIAL